MNDKSAISEFIIEKSHELNVLSASLNEISKKVIEKSKELDSLSKQLSEDPTNASLLATVKINQRELFQLSADLKSSQDNHLIKQSELKTLTSLL